MGLLGIVILGLFGRLFLHLLELLLPFLCSGVDDLLFKT